MPAINRIGVLTGGGDAPGLNAVIRAVVKSAFKARSTEGTFSKSTKTWCIGDEGRMGDDDGKRPVAIELKLLAHR